MRTHSNSSTKSASKKLKVLSKLPTARSKAMKVVKSPMFIEAVLVAGAGYLLWRNRAAIQTYIKKTGLTEKIANWFGREPEESFEDFPGGGISGRDKRGYDSASHLNQ